MAAQDCIRVMLVDDHDMIRFGLANYIHMFEDMDIIAEASDGEEAVTLCEQNCPDVILMDMSMPHMDGAEATRIISKKHPQTKIIIITSYEDDELVSEALKAGATSYLHKNISLDELGKAIRRTYNGESVLSAQAARSLVKASTHPQKPGHNLSKRECEVLALMARGFSNQQIGKQLSISHTTVASHVSKILSKLDVESRTEAVAQAIKHKLVS